VPTAGEGPLEHITVVVPTYQEAENIEPFLRAVRAAVPEARVVVCDDNSPDGTGLRAEEVAAELGSIEVLHRRNKEGLGAAYRHGFRHAIEGGADIVVQMDVDFSHPPEQLPELIDTVRGGADVAVGSRYVPGGGTPDWPLRRRLLSTYGNVYAGWQLGLAIRDVTSGFRAYRAATLVDIHVASTRANGYGFQIETGFRLTSKTAKVVEVPLVFVDRTRGTSKMSAAIMAENLALVTWWGLCRRAPGATGRFRRTRLAKRLTTWATPAG
jgi:dolichol-phosphate mannosyltransferase